MKAGYSKEMIIWAIIYVVAFTTGMFLIKAGGRVTSMGLVNRSLQLCLDWRTILGILCYICSFLIYISIISKAQLSYIYPMITALANTATVLGGVFLFGEKILPIGILGIVLILVGVILLSIKA